MTATLDRPEALAAFIKGRPDGMGIRAVAQAWTAAGGLLAIGQHAIRLLADDGRPYTAATIHTVAGTRLEVARVLLQNHGVAHDAFLHWADDIADMGLDASAKFPTIVIDDDVARLARIASAVRDLCLLTAQK